MRRAGPRLPGIGQPQPAAPSPAEVPKPSSVAGSGIPVGHLQVVPMSLPPEAGAAPGRFLDRKTKVMAVEDLSSLDYIAWVAQLGGAPRTVVVRDGFTFGSNAEICDLQVQGKGVAEQHAVLKLDASGLRLETTAGGGRLSQPLKDGDHFFVGDCEFAFKVASRNPMTAVAAVRLEVLDGMDTGRRLPLPEAQVFTLGSHATCDLVVRGDGVEPFHAIVLRKERLCVISDLGTAAGIGHLGQHVGFKKLKSSEEVTLGNVRLVYTYEEWEVGESDGVSYDDELHKTWNDFRDK
jgi:hypothetical protein